METNQFFEALNKFCDGNIEIRPLPGKQGFFEIGDNAGIDAHCKKFPDSDQYFGVATRNGRGGTKKHLVNIPAVWADIDFKDTPRKIVDQKLNEFPFKPSIIVNSGGGLHLYWFIKEPASNSDISEVEDVNRRIAAALGGDTTLPPSLATSPAARSVSSTVM